MLNKLVVVQELLIGSHAWNQVQLDGVLYNCDLTNDADFILEGLKLPFFLKSNADFGQGDYNRYSKYPPNGKGPAFEIATVTISDEMQEKLVEEQKELIQQQKLLREQELNSEPQKSPPRKVNFLSKLQSFLAKSFSKGDVNHEI